MLELNRIYTGDCLELMKQIPDKSIDMVLTDPPYNAKTIGPNHKKYSKGIMQLPKAEYKKFCKSWFKECQRISKNIVFTPGISNTHNYLQPYWIICWHKPAARSFNNMGGYNAWEPIFIYGKVKARIGQDYILRNTLNSSTGPEKKHPCPKPLTLWNFLIKHFSKEGEIILDPFSGSGTTGKACQEQNRNFILIDHIQRTASHSQG